MKRMDIKEIRRKNMRALSEQIGGIPAMAEKLDKDQNQIRHLIGNNPSRGIGHKIARELEAAFSKPTGWLDIDHSRGASGNQKTKRLLHVITKYIDEAHPELTPEQQADLIFNMLEEHVNKDLENGKIRDFIDFWVSVEKRRAIEAQPPQP